MKRPEKKDTRSGINANLPGCHTFALGYNKAIEEYEKFLPSEEEIIKIMQSFFSDFPTWDKQSYGAISKMLAKEISKRIGGG